MGLMDRLRRQADPAHKPATSWEVAQGNLRTQTFVGYEDLEVVGESNYQAALWSICGAGRSDRVRHEVVAVVIPEPENPYDPNAMAVYVDSHLVGYLDRSTAAAYGPGLRALMEQNSAYVALNGVIVGGGIRDDRLSLLGVWLHHNPKDFGIQPNRQSPPGRPVNPGESMRTGFSDAWLTDEDDDTYDLSWYSNLPDGDRPAVSMLQDLLASDPDPIDRHFQFAELEKRLYRCRDLYDSALDEFDIACRRHDAEMDVICQAFQLKWGKIPRLETYRQMAIRQQKKQDWESCLWWAERGLALYGDSAAREDAVEDLLKRRNRALVKLGTSSQK